MKRGVALVLLVVSLAAPALAADRPLSLTIDGRPVSRTGAVAVLHRRLAYVNLIELVRSYGGIVSVSSGATSVTVRARTATFVPGSAQVTVDKEAAEMPGPAYVSGGVLYVPLEFLVTRVAGGTVRIDAAGATARIAVPADGAPAATASP